MNKELVARIEEAFSASTKGVWGKGSSTHETVARNPGFEHYKIADFRHANDAQFCDLMHALAPEIIDALLQIDGSTQPVQPTIAPLLLMQDDYLLAARIAEGHRPDACPPLIMPLAGLLYATLAQPVQPSEPIGCVGKDGFTILYVTSELLPFETELYIHPSAKTKETK